MEKILTLLMERNKYIQKLYKVNCKEIERITVGQFDHIKKFYNTRNHLLDKIQKLEGVLNQALKEMPTSTTKSIKKQIQSIFEEKDQTVKKIIQQDLKILSIVESRKNQMIQELQGLNNESKSVAPHKKRKNRKGA